MSSSIKDTMEKKLQAAFSPVSLEVVNESHLHAGHHSSDGGAYDGAGETHFRIKIVSTSFSGMSRVDTHRAINDVLKHELNTGVHALAIEAKS